MPNQGFNPGLGGDIPQLLGMAIGRLKIVFQNIALFIMPIVTGDAVDSGAGAGSQGGPHRRGNGRLSADHFVSDFGRAAFQKFFGVRHPTLVNIFFSQTRIQAVNT